MSGLKTTRRSPLSGLGTTGTLIVTIALFTAAGFATPTDHAEGGVGQPPPNIIVILTDDQRADELAGMEALGSLLADQGLTFTRAFVSNPLCCPSRTTLLTGSLSHTNGVWTNGAGDAPELGGWPAFVANDHQNASIAPAFDGAGYYTALVGKYMNMAGSAPAEPGWDRWIAFGEVESPYFDYTLRIDLDGDGEAEPELVSYGSDDEDYSTDVLAHHAVSTITTAPSDEPLFLLFAPSAPHFPYIPAPRHVGSHDGEDITLHPSVNEEDVTDKPGYVQELGRLGVARLISSQIDRLEMLESVDEAIGTIVGALETVDRLENTIIVFTTDNGFLLGEHRWRGKLVPYEESIHVPLIVRWDGQIEPGTQTDALAGNVDLAPTLLEVAGIEPTWNVDGTSLLPLLLDDPSATAQRRLVIEHAGFRDFRDPPSYCGIRTSTDRLYIRYATGEEEYYNLTIDPFQLRNRASKPSAQIPLQRLRTRAEAACPYEEIPGFVPE